MVTNLGNATAHTATGFLNAPSAAVNPLTGKPDYTPIAPQTRKKPTGLDWDNLTPTCPTCEEKSGQIDHTGLCPGCRGEVEKTQTEAKVTSGGDSYVELDDADVARRFTAPTHAPRDEPEGETTPVSSPRAADPLENAAPARRVAPTVRAKVTRTSPHDILITLRTTNGQPIDQVAVAALLNDLLARLQHTTTPPAPAAATSTPAAAGPPPEGRTRGGEAPRPSGTPTPRRSRRKPPGPRARRRDKLDLPSPDIEDAYRAGATLRDLAETHGVSTPTIARHLDEHGVTRRKQKVTYNAELLEAVRTRYVDHGMTQSQVADDLDLTVKVVQTAMDRGDIEPRESAAARSQRGIGHPNKLQPDDQQDVVDAYTGGESAAAIAARHDITTATVYHCLDKHRIPRHGRRTPGTGADHAAGLKQQLSEMTATSREIKQWALEQGLVDHIARGVPPQRLVDAYAEAHPATATEGAA